MQSPNYEYNSNDEEENEENQELSDFSSLDSDQQPSIEHDQEGFKKYCHHKEKQIEFPTIPLQLPKLYQIYQQNLERKQKLKAAINQFVVKQITTLRIKYDEETNIFEEFIDIEEESSDYLTSKQNFETRQVELKRLIHHYSSLKTMHVGGMMKKDQRVIEILENFTKDNKNIIEVSVFGDKVIILSREKVWRKKGKTPIKNQLMVQEQKVSETLGQRVSSCSEDNCQHFKFTLRSFTFYQSKNGVSFHPMDKTIELTQGKKYSGFGYDIVNKFFVVHSQFSFGIVERGKKINLEKFIEVDRRIIKCEIRDKTLYVGTCDGIMHVFEINYSFLTLKLAKIAGCTVKEFSEVTHFCLTNNPDVILFVENRNKLCEHNLNTYTSYLLSELPEQVETISLRTITTQNLIYPDYYIPNVGRGKVVLHHHNALRKLINKQIEKTQSSSCKLVDITCVHNQDYVVLDVANGNFSIYPYKT